MRQVELRFRVRYAETDQMGVAHHGSYPAWLEMGRVEFMDAIGLPYREVEERGVFLVVVGLGLRYQQPALFDDELSLTTRLSELRSRLVRFEYALEKVADGSLLATGFTEHVAVEKGAGRRTVAVPAYIRTALEQS